MEKQLIIFALILLNTLKINAQQYSRVRIDLKSHSVEALARLGIEADHGNYVPGRYLETDLSQYEIELLRHQLYKVDLLIPDVSSWYAQQKGAFQVQERDGACNAVQSNNGPYYPVPAHYSPGTMGGYHTLDELLAVLDEMRAAFPHLISAKAVVSDTILTHQGRPQYWVRISDHPDQEEAEPKALYTALHHCREPLGLEQMLYFMWYVLENYDTRPEIKALIDHSELYFIPCLNPDGYKYNQTISPAGGGMWRKNRRLNNDGSYGVDLNRNYGYFWGHDNAGSSPNPMSETYRGPAPFSEPETRMVRDFCRAHDFSLALNYHTYGNLLIYPWAYSDQPAHPYLPWLAQTLTGFNRFKAGTTTETVGYAVNGSSDDWMHGEKDIFSYTPETGPGTYGFWPPADTILGLCRKTIWSNLALGWSLNTFAVSTDQSADVWINPSTSVPVQVKRFGLTDGPVTVRLKALTIAQATISPAEYTLNLPLPGADTVYFQVEWPQNLTPTGPIKWILETDNGTFTLRDTLTKTFIRGSNTVLSENHFTDTNTWTGTWDITTEHFVSPATSFTDSPFSDYAPNTFQETMLDQSVTIPADAVLPAVTFMARWDIETGYDWMAIFALDETGGETSLCGKYSHAGHTLQPIDYQVWDGTQDWVRESVSLEQFKGQNIRIKLVLGSDDFIEQDGFYIDDLVFSYTDTTNISSTGTPVFSSGFQIFPNPANEYFYVQLPAGDRYHLTVFNPLGQPVLAQDVTNGQRISIEHLSPGAYWVSGQKDNERSCFQKIVVNR